MMQGVGCPFCSDLAWVHIWTLRFHGSGLQESYITFLSLCFPSINLTKTKSLLPGIVSKIKRECFVKCPEHGNYSVMAAANYFFWKFVALIAPYAHIFFLV